MTPFVYTFVTAHFVLLGSDDVYTTKSGFHYCNNNVWETGSVFCRHVTGDTYFVGFCQESGNGLTHFHFRTFC
jgi:hypothetical protein